MWGAGGGPGRPMTRGRPQMSRMYTIPLYEDLCTGALKSFALEVFYQTQGRLHPNQIGKSTRLNSSHRIASRMPSSA